MDNKNAFAAWLLITQKENGEYYAESTQKSYFREMCKAGEQFPFLWNMSPAVFDRLTEIKQSEYYTNLYRSRQGELNSALELYKEFLKDRENGWQTIAEFSQGKQFATTNEFILHVTYNEPFSVKELSEFLQEFDTAFKDMLVEQGCSQAQARQMDMTITRVSEGSLWFEIATTVISIAMPILMFVLERIFKKSDEPKYVCKVDEKGAEVHKDSKKQI